MLKQRLLTSLWGIPLVCAAIWFDEPLPWFTLLIAGWGGLAVLEFYRAVSASKADPLHWFGFIMTVLLIISRDESINALLSGIIQTSQLIPTLLTMMIALPLIWILLRRQKDGALAGWAWTVAGVLYIGWLLGYLIALKDLPIQDARNWVFLAFFATFASDSSAFFAGRAFGKHKLAPDISPGKTKEGAAAGALGAVAVSLLFVLQTPFQLPLHWVQAAAIGLFVSVAGQLGDLAESLFKRNMGVKDSGTFLPGHGGLLDRMDSIAFAGVAVYYCALWLVS